MSIECAYSFFNLYEAAFKRQPSKEEITRFESLDQNEKNEKVKQWAKAAAWETKEKIGTDGLLYVAFAPRFE